MVDPIQTNTTPDDDFIDLFYGVGCDIPNESYNPYKDVMLSDFVFCPLDTNVYICRWVEHSSLCNSIIAITNMNNLKFNIEAKQRNFF